MTANSPQRYRLSLQPLSPVHVGSGETIEPYEYLLERHDEAGFLLVLDLPRLFAEMTPQQRSDYDRVVERGDFPGLRAWLRRHADPTRHRRYAIQVQDAIYEQIEQSLDEPQRLGEIHLCTRDAHTGRPYVPGSSIKGAIRTALVDATARDAQGGQAKALRELAGCAGHPKERRKIQHTQQFEAIALGHMTKDRNGRSRPDLYRDPLRQLAIADIPLADDACYIDRVQIVQRPDRRRQRDPRFDTDDASDILIYRDMTWSLADDEPVAFAGEARLSPHLADPQLMKKDKSGKPNWLPHAVEVEPLCAACNAFYAASLRHELETFAVPEDIAAPLLGTLDRLAANECLIRLGRHSHFECVTVSEPYRQPPETGFGKSRTYADAGRMPLGWAKLRFEPWHEAS